MITLTVLSIILIYSLFYTYNNDYSMFLYLILLIVGGLFVYQYIEYRINYYTEKIDESISGLKNKIDNSLSNIHFIKNILSTLFTQGK